MLLTPEATMVGRVKSATVNAVRSRVVSLRPPAAPKGSVLLSYITEPFRRKYRNGDWPTWHTNFWECRQIAQTFLDLGYSVDVIDWTNSDFLPKMDYAIFVDIHSNMERLAPMMPKDCVKLMHITGTHWKFQNDAEEKRLSDLERRRGVRLVPRRTVPPSRGIEFADAATVLGNEATLSTWRSANKPLYPIHVSTAVAFPWDEKKDFDSCRHNFLWFGANGLVLKGLDLVLEAFSAMPDMRLNVCGPISDEKDFEEAYRKELHECENIKVHGWVDPAGDHFRKIVRDCVAIVYPSASEGQSTGVTTCMHAGLVPLISRSSGVDVDGFGRILDDCTVDGISSAVSELARIPPDELRKMSRECWENARSTYTREAFSSEYRNAISKILGDSIR